MSTIKLSDKNEIKCNALRSIGITVSNYEYKNKTRYIVAIKNNPDADKFMDITFNSINEILLAFSDKLAGYKIIRA